MGKSQDSSETSGVPVADKQLRRTFLWKKILACSVATVILLVLYVFWFISGEPSVGINYVALLICSFAFYIISHIKSF